jgi:hypothetical protein
MRGNVEKALSGPCSRGNGRSWSRLTHHGMSCSTGHAAHQEGLGVEKMLWTLENDPLLRKAIECGLTVFIGLSWWVLAVLATAFR